MEIVLETTLNTLKKAVCKELLQRVSSGTATSSDIANAIRFLKECGIFPDKSIPTPPCSEEYPLPNDEELKFILGDD